MIRASAKTCWRHVWHLPSNGLYDKTALCDLELLFEGQNFKIVISLKWYELTQKCARANCRCWHLPSNGVTATKLKAAINTTRLWQQFEMSCTGYRCNNDLITNFATSSTSAFIRVHRHTYHLQVPSSEFTVIHNIYKCLHQSSPSYISSTSAFIRVHRRTYHLQVFSSQYTVVYIIRFYLCWWDRGSSSFLLSSLWWPGWPGCSAHNH